MFQLPKSFTVLRSRWLRGRGNSHSYLYRHSDAKMCCVGFFARAGGLRAKEIDNMKELGDVGTPLERALGEIYAVNDNEDLSDKERESKLKRRFADLGVRVTFK
ncbi:MAG: hypothetical protein KGJ13_09055 [Patescibacteria group bacterium]|nr:hypothetical protein [Patescibacteria group bacterium]